MPVHVRTLKRYFTERQSSFDDLAKLIADDQEFDRIDDDSPQKAFTQPLIERYYKYLLRKEPELFNEQLEVPPKLASETNKALQNYTFKNENQSRHSSLDTMDSETVIDPLVNKTDDDLALSNELEIEQSKGEEQEDDTVENFPTTLSYKDLFESYCFNIKRSLYNTFIGEYDKKELIERYMRKKKLALSYEEWKYASLKLDELTNTNKWKETTESALYDYKLIKEVTEKMRELRLENDYSNLLYLIRTNWIRNLGNMGNVNLYRHSHVGTKFLIDQYVTESKLCLESLLHSDLDDTYLLGILQQTRRNIGRTALVLSGGGSFGLFHIGVLATLFELDLLPRVISGSSAGAIVASILCVRHKEEIPELLERIVSQDFNIFQDDKQKTEGENLLIKISRFFKDGTWFDNKQLAKTVIEFLGDMTFREAYNRTGKILNIPVSAATLFEQPRLLNNLTAPNVLIWSAVCASCSLPAIFPSSPLYEKDPITGEVREWAGSASVKFVDGSVDNDLPISRLSEMFNIDHIIACQVNIHVFPFLKLSVSCVGGEIEDEFSARFKQNLSSVYKFMSNELIHLFEVGSELGFAKNLLLKMRSVLSQQYSGDITILPEMNTLLRWTDLICNPTKTFILREITNGAQATWPKISIIQNHCGQEFALDKAISFLKGKLIVSSSIKNPLQFSDLPVGLIQNANSKDRTENNILDDNLLESESAKSLSLLSEKNVSHNQHSSDSFSAYTTNLSARHRRRKSEISSSHSHKAKSFSGSTFSAMKHDRFANRMHRHYRNNSTERLYYMSSPHKNGLKKLPTDNLSGSPVINDRRKLLLQNQSSSVGSSPRAGGYNQSSNRSLASSSNSLRSRSNSISLGASSMPSSSSNNTDSH
ncbi:triacylglycerol lipase [Nakaseomyces bracarensis]|uniref:triacylglycerol lipase n=1 Tax=Nakaseomyces bracarensis TaxID=273131 RepID=UPI00387211F9